MIGTSRNSNEQADETNGQFQLMETFEASSVE